MMTNVIAYLHTTFAYQSAAMQLMVGQANFDAQQLHLKETLPIVVPARTNSWNVAMPPDGVAGGFATSNYVYRFNAGRLMSIQKKPQSRGAAPDAAEAGPSLIDTNGAYQLAKEWLAAISVDMSALESTSAHSVMQVGVRPAANANRERMHAPAGSRNRPGTTNSLPSRADASPTITVTNRSIATTPLFRVTWGGGRGPQPSSARTGVQVSVDILGSTKQCVGLHIQNPALFKGPPLQITNTAALLGPPPPPQHFVEQFLGGKAAYDAVAKPDRVAVWLLSSQADDAGNKTDRTPPVAVDVNTIALLSRALTDFNSYSWVEEKGCAPDYGVRLRFTRGGENVDVLWCYNCDHLQVTHNGQSAEQDCDEARSALVQAIKTVFPRDEIIRNLSLLNPNQSR